MYQVVAAIPSVFDVTPPPGLEQYIRWNGILEFPSHLNDLMIPSQCFTPGLDEDGNPRSSYWRRLFVGCVWPIALFGFAATMYILREIKRERDSYDPKLIAPRGYRSAVYTGLQNTLPMILVGTFVLVPSVSMRIFKSFSCDRIQLADGTSAASTSYRRYLHDDLALRCDLGDGSGSYSSDYQHVRNWAFGFIAIWPIGYLGWKLEP